MTSLSSASLPVPSGTLTEQHEQENDFIINLNGRAGDGDLGRDESVSDEDEEDNDEQDDDGDGVLTWA